MRRFVIVLLSLAIAIWVVLVVIRALGDRPPGRSADVDDPVTDENVAEDTETMARADAEVKVEVEVVSLASRSDRPVEQDGAASERQAEMAQLRAAIVAGVDRRPLYAMAQARGLPNHELFVMGSQQLLDAILDAEGLPPEDVLPSAQSAEAIRAIADEAFQRQAAFAAEQAAERDAG